MNLPAHSQWPRCSPPTDHDPPHPAPGTHRVLVVVEGAVDASDVAALSEAITAALGIALHLEVDLSGVARVTPAGLGALLDLSRTATRRGTCLHITGVTRSRGGPHQPEHTGSARSNGL